MNIDIKKTNILNGESQELVFFFQENQSVIDFFGDCPIAWGRTDNLNRTWRALLSRRSFCADSDWAFLNNHRYIYIYFNKQIKHRSKIRREYANHIDLCKPLVTALRESTVITRAIIIGLYAAYIIFFTKEYGILYNRLNGMPLFPSSPYHDIIAYPQKNEYEEISAKERILYEKINLLYKDYDEHGTMFQSKLF